MGQRDLGGLFGLEPGRRWPCGWDRPAYLGAKRAHAGVLTIGIILYRELPHDYQRDMRCGFRIDRRENQMARRAINDRLPEAIRRDPLDPEALDRLLRDEQARMVAW